MTARALTPADVLRHGGELATPERIAKALVIRVTEDKKGARAMWVGDDSKLGAMALDERITGRQYQAGCEFRKLDYRAHGPDLKAASMEPSIRGGGGNHSDLAIAARQQLALIRAVLGEELNACLIAICAKDEAPSSWARSRNLHPTNGMYALNLALTMLADKMGLEKD